MQMKYTRIFIVTNSLPHPFAYFSLLHSHIHTHSFMCTSYIWLCGVYTYIKTHTYILHRRYGLSLGESRIWSSFGTDSFRIIRFWNVRFCELEIKWWNRCWEMEEPRRRRIWGCAFQCRIFGHNVGIRVGIILSPFIDSHAYYENSSYAINTWKTISFTHVQSTKCYR